MQDLTELLLEIEALIVKMKELKAKVDLLLLGGKEDGITAKKVKGIRGIPRKDKG